MKVLRPDPAEYVEDFGIGPVRPIDVLSGAIGYAMEAGLSIRDLDALVMRAESVRHFDKLIDDEIGRRKAIRDRKESAA